MPEAAHTRERDSWTRLRVVGHAVGNLLLGISLGLVSQYAVTDVVNAAEQRALGTRLVEVARTRSVLDDRLSGAGTPMDLSRWAREDAAYWAELPDGEPFGRLVIPAMGLDCVVVKGADPADLKRGPGWIPGTDLPGGTGNAGIAGHRTTYGSPFGRIDELEAGDLIHLYSPYRRYTYEVTRSLVVTPRQVEVIASTVDPQLTLTACHPRYSARYRYVVQAKLTAVRRLEAAAAP